MTLPEARTFPCSVCGAPLEYDAGTQAMKCRYCQGQQAVVLEAPPSSIREIPIEEGLQRAPRGLAAEVLAIVCGECGATVNVGQREMTAECTFCRSHKVLPQPADPNLIRPESLVPFAIDRAQAGQRFSTWLKQLWFRPNDLRKLARVEEMGGVYIPFWTFDADVFSKWTADAGYYYYETEHYTVTVNGRRESRTRQVRRTRWVPAWGRRSDHYDDALVCASKGLPRELVSGVSSFDTGQLLPYSPQFLAGWRAESYAVDLMLAWQQAQSMILAEQERRCAGDVPGDTHRFLSVDSEMSNVTFKHVLLPIWIAAYRYQGKVYRFLVNGQTGEISGKAPWSFWKIFFFVLTIAAMIGIFVILASEE